MQHSIKIQRFKNVLVQQHQFLIAQLLGGLGQSTIVLYLDAIEQWTRRRAPGLTYLHRLTGGITGSVAFCWLSLNRCGGSRFSFFLVVFCSLGQNEPLSFLLYSLKKGKQDWKIFDLNFQTYSAHFSLGLL